MKGDFSRITHDESKHYVGTYLQQGRVQVDADWNENVDTFQSMLKKLSADSLGTCACLDDSFKIGTDVPIDHMVQPDLWSPIPIQENLKCYILLNTKDFPQSEKGSLFIENAEGIERGFNSLDLSRFKQLIVRFKPLTTGGDLKPPKRQKEHQNETIRIILQPRGKQILYEWEKNIGDDVVTDARGFLLLNFDLSRPTSISSDDLIKAYDLSDIAKISIEWTTTSKIPICIGMISAEPFAVVVAATTANQLPNDRNPSWLNVNGLVSAGQPDFDNIYRGKPTIRMPQGVDEITWEFANPINFKSLLSKLKFAANVELVVKTEQQEIYPTNNKQGIVLVTELNEEVEVILKPDKLNKDLAEIENQWYAYTIDITDSKNIPYTKIKSIKIKNLKYFSRAKEELCISEILGEINFKKNFIIVGVNNLELAQPARMYVNGIACQREYNETYLTQVDNPPVIEIPDKSTYLVYADVWQRGITYIEDPEIKEIALEGPDTTTRLKTICQIKLKEIKTGDGDDDTPANQLQQKVRMAKHEMNKMIQEKPVRLSIIPNADYVGVDNRLYRIQIHDSGRSSNKSPTFKWSADNASLAFPVQEVGEFNVILKPISRRSLDNIFKIGDFIEITDDLDDLSEQPKGELRRIVDIDLDKQSLSWNLGNVIDQKSEDSDYFQAKVNRHYLPSFHPKIVKWDGLKSVQVNGNGSIGIPIDDDGQIKIKFSNGVFRSGDYWNFTVRALTIQNLFEVPPRGVNHHYAMLALIEKSVGRNMTVLEDLRKTSSSSLSNIRAVDVAYDNVSSLTTGSTNVQQVLQTLCKGVERNVSIRRGRGNQGEEGFVYDLSVHVGEHYDMKAGEKARFNYEASYENPPILLYNIETHDGRKVEHRIEDISADEEERWVGFYVTPEENSKMSWISLGRSSYYSDFLAYKVLELIFGEDIADKLRKDEEHRKKWSNTISDIFERKHEKDHIKNQIENAFERFENNWKKIFD